jgi:hypothetical protein
MVSNAQIKLNELGIDGISLGMNVNNVRDIVPFSSCQYKDLFSVFPSDKNFYYLNVNSGNSVDHLNIKYIFVYADDAGVIKRFFFLIDDSDNTTENILHKLYGIHDVSSDSFIGEYKTRQHLMWTTKAHATVFMSKNLEINRTAHFPVTEIQIYHPSPSEEYGDYFISFKLPRE